MIEPNNTIGVLRGEPCQCNAVIKDSSRREGQVNGWWGSCKRKHAKLTSRLYSGIDTRQKGNTPNSIHCESLVPAIFNGSNHFVQLEVQHWNTVCDSLEKIVYFKTKAEQECTGDGLVMEPHQSLYTYAIPPPVVEKMYFYRSMFGLQEFKSFSQLQMLGAELHECMCA